MLEQPEDQEERLEQSDTSVDPDQVQQQLDELERLHAATDQAAAGLEAAAPRRTFGRTVSRATNFVGRRLFPGRIGPPTPDYTPEEAQQKLALYDAVDNMYAAALRASGYDPDAFTRLQSLAPDRIVEQSREIAEPPTTSSIAYEPRLMLREAQSWRTESKFTTEHHPAVEGMTPERVTDLAEKLHTIIQNGVVSPLTHASGGYTQGYWTSSILPPYDAAPGESGGNLNIGDETGGYTLYYLDHPIDGSDAKLGLWSHDGTSDKKIWIVAARRNGNWKYEGADLQTDLQPDHPTAVWNTVEPSAGDVEIFMDKIESRIGDIYNDLTKTMTENAAS